MGKIAGAATAQQPHNANLIALLSDQEKDERDEISLKEATFYFLKRVDCADFV